VERVLVAGVPGPSRPLPGSKSGKGRLVGVGVPGHPPRPAVWKPRQRLRDIRHGNVPPGTEWKRERLAYVVSEVLGLGIVPATVVRVLDGTLGSLQDYRVGAAPWKGSGFRYEDVGVRDWQKLTLLDWVTCNTDRHRRNWLVEGERIWAIDNGLTFPERGEWGPFRGYRSRPHQLLSEHGDLKLLDDVRRSLTGEAKAEITRELLRFGVGERGRQIFCRRWWYLVLTQAFPEYVEQEKGFMREPGRLE